MYKNNFQLVRIGNLELIIQQISRIHRSVSFLKQMNYGLQSGALLYFMHKDYMSLTLSLLTYIAKHLNLALHWQFLHIIYFYLGLEKGKDLITSQYIGLKIWFIRDEILKLTGCKIQIGWLFLSKLQQKSLILLNIQRSTDSNLHTQKQIITQIVGQVNDYQIAIRQNSMSGVDTELPVTSHPKIQKARKGFCCSCLLY